MSFNSDELKHAFPVNAGPDENRNLNLGGAIQDPRVYLENDTFYNAVPDITREIVGNIGTTGTWNIYYLMYIENTNGSVNLTDGKLLIYKQPTNPNVSIRIGLAPQGINGTAGTIANRTTAPSGVSFTTTKIFGYPYPLTTPNSGALNGDEYFGLWTHISGPKGTASIPEIRHIIEMQFKRPV